MLKQVTSLDSVEHLLFLIATRASSQGFNCWCSREFFLGGAACLTDIIRYTTRKCDRPNYLGDDI